MTDKWLEMLINIMDIDDNELMQEILSPSREYHRDRYIEREVLRRILKKLNTREAKMDGIILTHA